MGSVKRASFTTAFYLLGMAMACTGLRGWGTPPSATVCIYYEYEIDRSAQFLTVSPLAGECSS